MSRPIVDIRGEPCGMPILRVEKFLIEKSGRAPFTVLGDDARTMDQMRILAARHGWQCEVTLDWRAEFQP
jgi:TusA-related sulfurtransferase